MIINKNKRVVILWILLIVWSCFSIFLSRQDGTQTTSLSTGITSGFLRVFNDIFGFNIDFNVFHAHLRKSAHFIIYFVFSILLFSASYFTFEIKKNKFIVFGISTFVIGGIVAVFDELQKKFIPGRHCQWDEVLLNGFGVLVGTVLVVFIFRFIIRKKGGTNGTTAR